MELTQICIYSLLGLIFVLFLVLDVEKLYHKFKLKEKARDLQLKFKNKESIQDQLKVYHCQKGQTYLAISNFHPTPEQPPLIGTGSTQEQATKDLDNQITQLQEGYYQVTIEEGFIKLKG